MKITTLLTAGAAFASLASANTPLLTNTDFSNGYEGWIAGSNLFVGGQWQAFVSAPEAYTFESRVMVEGEGFIFESWDDEVSDMLENYLFQEFAAGPVGSPTENQLFATGDEIVFKGKASASTSGADTSDVVTRAFIKVLGYNELGWEFQIKEAYSAFQPLGSDLTEFELRVTFPDLTVDDSLQVIQLGFEATTSYDAGAGSMDSASVYFEDIEGYIEGDGILWAGWPVDENGWANTEGWLGWVNVTSAPWIQILSLDSYGYVQEGTVGDAGAWIYILGN